MKYLALILLCGALVSIANPAAARAGRSGGADLADWFDKADADRDGLVTAAEFAAFRQAQFGQFDRNGDGTVSPGDFPRLARMRPDAHAKLTAMLAQSDANGDGAVTRAEWAAAPPRLFALADADGNDEVTRAEYDAARTSMKAALSARER